MVEFKAVALTVVCLFLISKEIGANLSCITCESCTEFQTTSDCLGKDDICLAYELDGHTFKKCGTKDQCAALLSKQSHSSFLQKARNFMNGSLDSEIVMVHELPEADQEPALPYCCQEDGCTTQSEALLPGNQTPKTTGETTVSGTVSTTVATTSTGATETSVQDTEKTSTIDFSLETTLTTPTQSFITEPTLSPTLQPKKASTSNGYNPPNMRTQTEEVTTDGSQTEASSTVSTTSAKPNSREPRAKKHTTANFETTEKGSGSKHHSKYPQSDTSSKHYTTVVVSSEETTVNDATYRTDKSISKGTRATMLCDLLLITVPFVYIFL